MPQGLGMLGTQIQAWHLLINACNDFMNEAGQHCFPEYRHVFLSQPLLYDRHHCGTYAKSLQQGRDRELH